MSRRFGRKKQGGVTLVELMVSVLVMSIGVLGVAALQVVSLQQNRNAIMESDAIRLANDLIDRILANPGVIYGPVASYASSPTMDKSCVGNICSENEMASYDTAQWLCALGSTDPTDDSTYATCSTLGVTGALPYGTGTVVYDAATRVYAISVRWQDDREGNTRDITVNFKRDEI